MLTIENSNVVTEEQDVDEAFRAELEIVLTEVFPVLEQRIGQAQFGGWHRRRGSAQDLAQELRAFLKQRFRIAVRVQDVHDGASFRLLQPRKPKPRRLVDIRLMLELPPAKRVRKVMVLAPEELIAQKVIAWVRRRGKPKAGTDARDVAMLLLRFPDLKSFDGGVLSRLNAAGASDEVMSAWKQWVSRKIVPEHEDDKFAW